jgi:hypothetical protein
LYFPYRTQKNVSYLERYAKEKPRFIEIFCALRPCRAKTLYQNNKIFILTLYLLFDINIIGDIMVFEIGNRNDLIGILKIYEQLDENNGSLETLNLGNTNKI